MILRKEINNILYYPETEETLKRYPRTYKIFKENIDLKTDKIISVFEKLIDDEIEECRKENFAEVDEVIGVLEDLKEKLKK